jgi:hypothetical protein
MMKFVLRILEILHGPELHLHLSTPQGPELDLPGLFWTTGTCAALCQVCVPQGPELHLDLPGLFWTTGTCAALCQVCVPQGPELHLDVSGQPEPLLLQEVSITTGTSDLHLDVSGQKEPKLLLDLSTLQRPVLHLDVSTLQRHVLLLDVSIPQWPELHRNLPGLFWTTGTCAALGQVCVPQGPELNLNLPGLFWTTGNCAALGQVCVPQGPELHLDVCGQQMPLLFLYIDIITEFREILSNHGHGIPPNFRQFRTHYGSYTEVLQIDGIPC